MKILDLFCKAGGCSMGYHRAGFECTGVDIEPQKHYPFEFHRGDALEVLRDLDYCRSFDLIHASPPCQAYSVTKSLSRGNHPELVEPVRAGLIATGEPYIIENVVGAPLLYPVRLCGSSFGLDLRRHRLFESNLWLRGKACRHKWQMPRFAPNGANQMRDKKLSCVVGVYGHGSRKAAKDLAEALAVSDPKDLAVDVAGWRLAIEIDWMTRDELAQAIPPAYTEYLGKQVIELLGKQKTP